jgi:hypothetical protein
MSNQETALSNLTSKFGKESWFHSASIDPEFGKDIVLYAKTMDQTVLTSVPDKQDDVRVRLHFAAFKEISSQKQPTPIEIKTEVKEAPKETIAPKEVIVVSLADRLAALSEACGEESVRNIVYDVHSNKSTRDSKTYPEARKQIEALYKEFGFEQLYQELIK